MPTQKVINNPPKSPNRGPSEQSHLQALSDVCAAATRYGTTAERPSITDPKAKLWIGQPFFDTTLQKLVIWNGTTWVY